MKKIYFIYILLLCFIGFFYPHNVFADISSNLHLFVDKIAGTTDDNFSLNITFKKTAAENYFFLNNIVIPGIENFRIIGNFSNNNIQIINGVTEEISEKNFLLQPLKEGTFTLGPIKINSSSGSGKVLESESVTIKVEKSLNQKTKEALLAPLEEKNQKTPDESNQKSLQNNTSSKENTSLPSEKIKTISFTNWYFWSQIFAGFLIFIGGVFIGKVLFKK